MFLVICFVGEYKDFLLHQSGRRSRSGNFVKTYIKESGDSKGKVIRKIRQREEKIYKGTSRLHIHTFRDVHKTGESKAKLSERRKRVQSEAVQDSLQDCPDLDIHQTYSSSNMQKKNSYAFTTPSPVLHQSAIPQPTSSSVPFASYVEYQLPNFNPSHYPSQASFNLSSVHHGDIQSQQQRGIPSSVSHGTSEHHDDILVQIIGLFYMCYSIYIYILEMHNNSTSSVHHGEHQYQYQYHPQRNIPSSVSHGKPEHHDYIFIYIIVLFFYMCYYLYIYILEEMHNSSTSSVHHGEHQSHLPRSKSRNHDGKLNLIFV